MFFFSNSFSLKPSKIHFIKVPSTPYYTLNCSKTSSTCKYISLLAPHQTRQLASQFSKKVGQRDTVRSKGGRHIISYRDGANIDKNTWKLKENIKSRPDMRIIPYVDDSSNNKTKTVRKITGENDILRPKLSFMSNARPSMMKWRELEIEKTPIINISKNEKYKARSHKKYEDNIRKHSGYARNVVDAKNSPLPNIHRQRFMKNLRSPTSWVSSPNFLNGLPKTIYHFKYPLKTRNLGQ